MLTFKRPQVCNSSFRKEEPRRGASGEYLSRTIKGLRLRQPSKAKRLERRLSLMALRSKGLWT